MTTTCRRAVLDAVAALMTRNGGMPVSVAEIVSEVGRNGGRYAESTVRTHVTAHMCVNAARPPEWPDLRRVDRGLYVPVEPSQASAATPTSPEPAEPSDARSWPWEGAVQAVFVAFLADHGWTVTSAADTASKARGVDVLAVKGDRHLGAEVKGFPSSAYSDPRRAGEVKPTAPTNQAGHWFSQAVTKALMLLDTHPEHESLVVLPNFPRYRDLASRTRTGRRLADVHVVLVSENGVAESESWRP
jgi:hypothetical protein